MLSKEKEITIPKQTLDTLLLALQANTSRKVYTPELLARHLNKSVKTIHNWKDKGNIKYSQIGSSIFFQDKHVELFLDENQMIVNSEN